MKIILKTLAATVLFASMLLLSSCEDKPLMAIIKTSRGNITLDLYGEATPLTVSNFVNLAQRGYYDSIRFHRVVPNFVIQGGDPMGTGRGGPGYKFEDEFQDTLKHDGPGVLSMANAGPTTNGSQFFITHRDTPHLDGKHSVFGRVVDGMDVVNAIKQNDMIYTIQIVGDVPEQMEALQSRIDEWNATLDENYKDLKPAQPIDEY